MQIRDGFDDIDIGISASFENVVILASAESTNDSAVSHDYSVDSNLASAKKAHDCVLLSAIMQSCSLFLVFFFPLYERAASEMREGLSMLRLYPDSL